MRETPDWLVALVVVAYVVIAGLAIHRAWKRWGAGPRRIVVTTAVAAAFFGPALLVGHGVGIGPWWLAVLACVAQRCSGPDARFYLAVFVLAPTLALWLLCLLIGFTVHLARR